ncbi:MAG: hypothetical protein ABSC48_10085 [Terracidiphilus sp.]
MSEENPIEAAIQSRLEGIEQEIDRLTRLAAGEKETAQQRQNWELARDMQTEARKLREELSKLSIQSGAPKRWPFLGRLRKTLTPRSHAH